MHSSMFLRALALAAALASGGVAQAATPAGPGTEVSTRKPAAELFAPGSAKLSAAGERWLRSRVVKPGAMPERMVVVSMAGADNNLQRQRAKVLRQRLAALGVPTERVYFEAT